MQTNDETEFLKAIDRYKRVNSRPHPTWQEVFAVAVALGYRKVAQPQPMPRKTHRKKKEK